MTNYCKTCPVSTGTHKPAEAVHQIAEPAAQAPDEAQIKALMRKHRIWIEHSTLLEGDEPERELRAVQAEEHQFNAFVQDLIAATQLTEAPQAVQPAVPDGWVPCVITYEGQHPEEIAYGPQAMMDRLKKWLDRYFEMRTAPAHPAEGVPAPMPVAHPHHCTARTADGSCEECEGHAQAMAEWNTERAALAATQPAAQGMDAQMLNFINDKRVALTPEYEGPWKAEVFADEAEPVITTEGSTVRDAVSAAIAAQAKQGGA